MALTYISSVTALWYATRDTWFGERRLLGPLFFVGWALLFALLRRSRVCGPLKRETWVVSVSGFVCLTLFWYFGRAPNYAFWFGRPPRGSFGAVLPFMFMCLSGLVLRLLVPWLIARLTLGTAPRDYGAQAGQRSGLTWAYVLALVIGVTAVLYVSQQPQFLARYPMCRHAIQHGQLNLWVFLAYQVAYACLFISGEGFFRGFLVLGLGRQLGPNAIFVALIPYVLIHYGKPAPEAFGAILTGLFLGTLAYRHRSFWYGAGVHWLVALSMDLAAIAQRHVVFVY